MKFSPWELYKNGDEFFNLHGNAVMRLSPDAAIQVCEALSRKGISVIRIEGGIHDKSGFESRRDCIWDSLENKNEVTAHEDNNREAVNFIGYNRNVHNAFVITISE